MDWRQFLTKVDKDTPRSMCSVCPSAALGHRVPDWGRRDKLRGSAGLVGPGSLTAAVTLPFYTQGWHHSSRRMSTNNICVYIKEIFINIKSKLAKDTSSPAGKSRDSAQMSPNDLSTSSLAARKPHLPAITIAPPNLLLNPSI